MHHWGRPMRNNLIVLAVFAAMSLPACAARPISVGELQQTLTTAHASHQPDAAVMQQLSDVRLTARLTGTSLQKLVANSPGPKTTEALRAIAGASAFLEPPPNELPATPAPPIATQKVIIGRTIDYVSHTLPTLPNFLATRETVQYVDTLKGMQQEPEPRGGLLLVGTATAPIGFRDGRETDDPTVLATHNASKTKGHATDTTAPAAIQGLVSWGEFGPILGVVLMDAAKGKLSWARWEQEDGKPIAVFQFSVDRSISDYNVSYCCHFSLPETAGAISDAVPNKSVTIKPGYHGHLEVDPETGIVLRITIEVDLLPGDPMQRSSMMVEYGPVKIGGSVHICPVNSVSVSVSPSQFLSPLRTLESVNRLRLNVVEFTGYRLFGSESRLVTALPPKSDSIGEPASRDVEQASDSGVTATVNSATATIAPTLDSNPAPLANAATAESEADNEIVIQSADTLPVFSTEDSKAENGVARKPDPGFTLKVSTRLVDLGLVATDKHGKPVTNLKQDEIEVYDNGQRQQLQAFRHNSSAVPQAPQQTQPAHDVDTFTNTSAASANPQDTSDLMILLLDESHLPNLDLNRARGEILRFLAGSAPDSRIALYSLNERGFHVIQDVTQDHALVTAKLTAWTPSAESTAHAQAAARKLDQSQHPESVTTNNAQVGGAYFDAPEMIQTTDAELSQMGTNPLRYALEVMTALARHFGAVSGHKSIVWISADVVLANWQNPGGKKFNAGQQAALENTREALNEARIALYVVDASILKIGMGGFDATVENPNGVQAAIQNGPMQPRASAPPQAQVLQDLMVIQEPVRELAEATGGRAINKGSDLKAALDGVDRDSNSLYEIGFNPDTPADGKFHTLEVKIPKRKDVTLRYRTGYLYSAESRNTQQRFQQVVWSPQDATGIALTAHAVPATNAASGQRAIELSIGFPGLSLEQKDGRWTGKLYVFVAERDDAVQKAEVSGDVVKLNLRQDTYGSGMPAGIPYHRNVDPKSKLGSIRIIVVDGNSGKMGSVTVPSSALHP